MFWDNVIDFVTTYSKTLIGIAITIFVTLIILFIIRFTVSRIVKKAKNRRAITLARLVQSIVRYIIIIISIIVIIGIAGYDITALLAGAGIAGLIIGLGSQDLIKDLLSGLGIVFEDYYEIDDIVEIKGFKGKVVEVGIRSTKVLNWKGELKIFANGEIKEITNFSRNFSLAVALVTVDYKENIEEVINILQEKLPDMKEQFPQIIEGPNVLGVSDLGASGVDIRVSAKTLSETHYAVERGLRKRIKEICDEHNIKIPVTLVELINE